MTATAYAAVHLGRRSNDISYTRFTPLHANPVAAARNGGAAGVVEVQFELPREATLKAFALDGSLLSEGLDLDTVLATAEQRDTPGFGALVSVYACSDHPAVDWFLANGPADKSLFEFVSSVRFIDGHRSENLLAA